MSKTKVLASIFRSNAFPIVDCNKSRFTFIRNIQMSAKNDRSSRWEGKWSSGQIGFHLKDVNSFLKKYINELRDNKKIDKIFFPLCGKSVDMKWLADQGMTVIGVDIIPQALREFYAESNVEFTEEAAPTMGPECQLLKSKDGRFNLYCGDVFLYNESMHGKFDAIWDRAALVALDRPDVPGYVKLLTSLLNPNGKILLETIEYDLEAVKDESGYSRHPPPHTMYEDEIRKLFEPTCSVAKIDASDRLLANKPAVSGLYLIVKH